MNYYAIILAGGIGRRMRNNVPKQFITIKGIPLLMYSIQQFYSAIPNISIIVVLPKSKIGTWENICKEYSFAIPHKIAEGGPERFHSVKNGLFYVKEDGIVAIHDGARPLIDKKLIKKIFELTIRHDNAVPAIAIKDSLRIVDAALNKQIDRKSIKAIQTPQCFMSSAIIKAYRQVYSEEFTDDASVYEKDGNNINLIEGDTKNIKITFPEDIAIAEALLSYTSQE